MKHHTPRLSPTLSGPRLRGGFTLIELLVLVLIIGILAAISLPQYQNAVTRSRYPQLQMAARTVHDAALRFYLANDAWPSDLTEMDVNLRGELAADALSVSFADSACDYFAANGWDDPSVLCYTTKGHYLGFRMLHESDEQYCLAPAEEAWSTAFCESIGGVPTEVPSVASLMQYALP